MLCYSSNIARKEIKMINRKLKKYIEDHILPSYERNDVGHGLEHIQYVIKRSLKFAKTLPDINEDMVYVIAAYHDIGHYIDAKNHEMVSAEMLRKDTKLKEFFSEEEISIMADAVEDHRASMDGEPRTIYGKIVSSADRNNTVEKCLYRSYFYGKKLDPKADDQSLYERAFDVLTKKFGESGYAKFYFEDPEYEAFLKEIRELLSNKEDIKNSYIVMNWSIKAGDGFKSAITCNNPSDLPKYLSEPAKYIICLGDCHNCSYCKDKDDLRTVVFINHFKKSIKAGLKLGLTETDLSRLEAQKYIDYGKFLMKLTNQTTLI